ncbi:restriction endonuclease subunit S [Bacteroides acidifaciens]|uniref:restriction endonuclease subunit S n=1 Tax=Bacteroides acidifaciens TaxID=85831 RepID=UPI0025A4D46D|nr:restriction endonuclease subunit S [Bacteroides acidifaciens]
MEQWKQYKLGELITLNSGGTPDKSNKSYWGGDIPWISAKFMYDDYLYSSELKISQEGLDNGSRLAPKGSILLLTRGSGLFNHIPVCYVMKDLAYNQDVKCIESNNKELVSTKFLFYWLMGNKNSIGAILETTGIGAGKIDTNRLKDIRISLPPKEYQQALIGFAESIMHKIELNRRINDNLEQQAQALFKAWFVDFEPFKDGKFVESELGMIPEGCRVGKAEDFYNINIGKTPPRKEQIWFSSNSSDYTWVSISDLGSCGRFVFTSSEFLTHEAIKRHNIILVPKDTILLSFKLTIGRVGIAGTELTTNEAIARFITSDENREYTYFLLKGYNYEKLGSTSSIATAVNSKIIKAMVVLMPDKEILKAFSSLTKPYFDQILRNEQESIRLTILRDTLLPKLMSGELKINATEVL